MINATRRSLVRSPAVRRKLRVARIAAATSAAARWVGVIVGFFIASGVFLRAHGDDQAMVQQIIQAITEELAQKPDTDLLIRRGELYRHGREWAKADADFAAAAQREPHRAMIVFLRARTLLDAGEPAKAEPFAEQYRERAPGNPEAWFLRGEVRAARGQTDLALIDYSEGFRRAPEANLEQVSRWTSLLAKLPRRAADSIVPILDDALARWGPIPALSDLAITLEIARGNFDAALSHIDRALQPGRWQGTLLARRGDVLVQSGRRGEAVTAYRAALAAIEKLPDRNRALADVQRLAREARDALERLSLNDRSASQ